VKLRIILVNAYYTGLTDYNLDPSWILGIKKNTEDFNAGFRVSKDTSREGLGEQLCVGLCAGSLVDLRG
jgi:hypothetical protein